MIAVAAIVAAAACGPSGKQVATAKQARYQGDQQQLFAVIKQTVASKYKIEKSDEAALGVQTEGRWYNPEGQAISANIGDVRDVPDQSLNISIIVELLPDGPSHVVSVKPQIVRFTKARPDPEVLEPTDPSIPAWALGKGDNLQVALYEALKAYEVQVTAGAAAPAADPAAPAADPADPAADPAAPAADPGAPAADPTAPAADPAAPAP